jgi:RNA polymerase sigma-70 factor (ECF subfamily)
MRRRAHSDELRDAIARRLDELSSVNAERAALDIEDDRLRLVFTCCHPALAPVAQIAMTLREVCDLTTEHARNLRLVASLSVFVALLCANMSQAQGALPADLDAWVARSMRTFGVPGMAIAIVKDGKVVIAKGYGVKTMGAIVAKTSICLSSKRAI